MVTRVPLKLKDSADFQDFSLTEENYLAYQVGKYLISGDSSDVGSLTMDSSGTQYGVGTFTNTVYDSAVGTGGAGSFLTFSTVTTTLRTNLGTITPADSDYRIPVFREHDSDRGTITVGRPSSIPAGAAGYVTISNVSGDSLTIKIPSSRNKVFDTFCASSINIADSAVNGTAVAGGNISLGSGLHEPPKLLAPIVRGVTTGRYEDSDDAYVFNVENVTIGGTAYSSSEAKIEYQAGDDYIYVDNVDQDIYQSKIREYNDSDMNVLIDRLNGRIATSDYLGSYRLGSVPPDSSDYTLNLANVMTDTRTDGHSLQYNIYQKTTQSAPTQVLPFAIKRSNGDSGDYQGLQLMTDRQIQQSLGLRARNRLGTIADQSDSGGTGTFVGNYKLLSSTAGTPTDLGFSGTWAARGTATDTRQDIVDANYSRNRVSTYARLRDSTFSADYSRTRSSNYSDDYSRVRSSAYSDTYTVNRESNYSVGFVGDYSRNFTRTRSSSYTRTRQSTFNYTRARASTFTGNYSRVVTYAGNFLGNYARTSTTSDTDPEGNAPSQGVVQQATPNIWTYKTEAESSIAQVIYNSGGAGSYGLEVYNDGVSILATGGPFSNPTTGFAFNTTTSGTFYWEDGDKSAAFSGTTSWELGTSLGSYTSGSDTYKYFKIRLIGTFSNDFVGNYTRTSTRNSTNTLSYSRNRASTFTGNYSRTLDYLGNYSRNFLGEYARDFTRTTPDNFTRDFLGNYSRDFSRTRTSSYSADYSRTRSSNYIGDYVGNFAGNFVGNYVGSGTTTAPTVLTQHSVNLAQYETTSPGNGVFSGWDEIFTMTNVPGFVSLTTSDIRCNAYQDRGSGTWSGLVTLRAINVANGDTLWQDNVSVSNVYQSFLRSPGSLRTISAASFTTPGIVGSTNNSIRFEAGCQTNHGHSSCVEVFTVTVADGYDYQRTSTRTSLVDYLGDYSRNFVGNYTGNYSRNFSGQYSREYTRTRTSTYLGSDTFSRTFTGNYVGNYSRDFTRTFEGNYSRNFVGNYTGNYSRGFLGNYSRTFIGNYAGDSIGSGSTNIETYTLYVRTS